HCLLVVVSVHGAEDALQETLLRAWRGLPEFGGRSSLRTWLYRIATNASLDAIARRPRRVLPVDYAPMGTPPENGARTPPGGAPATAGGPAAPRRRLDRARPGPGAGGGGRLRLARGALRAARGRRARV